MMKGAMGVHLPAPGFPTTCVMRKLSVSSLIGLVFTVYTLSIWSFALLYPAGVVGTAIISMAPNLQVRWDMPEGVEGPPARF
jgi:hypothetical protein